MEEFDLVEADFQQYYRLNLGKIDGFLRYARLFANLPPESRIMKHLNPVGAWSFSDETQSRILFELGQIAAILYNVNKPKSAKRAEAAEQFQPEVVDQAKKEFMEEQKAEKQRQVDEGLTAEFWQSRHPNIKFL